MKLKSVVESVKETRDYDIVPFKQRRGSGDSGPLLLATNKTNAAECYIIKHRYADNAANEFIYSSIGQALGAMLPDVVLFKLTEKPNPYRILETDYIMGSSKIDILIEKPRIEQILATKNWQDYYRFIALRGMFDEYDSFETPISNENIVYRIDTSASFGHEMDIKTVIQMACHSQYCDLAKKMLADYNYDRPWEERGFLREKSICEKVGGIESVSIYLETFARLIELSESYIDSVIHTLGAVYSDLICNHYKRYIIGIQKQAASFLKNQL